MRIRRLAQERNAMSPARARALINRSGDESTNPGPAERIFKLGGEGANANALA